MSTPERESEVKLALDGPRDIEKLLGPDGLAGPRRVEVQENLYFDTVDLVLARALAMLRLRLTAGKSPLLTLKCGTEVEAGFFRSVEIEAPVDAPVAEGLRRDPPAVYRLNLEPINFLRERHGVLPLAVIGSLHNERTSVAAGRFLVELDRIRFPDGSEEFEVEIETEEPVAALTWIEGEFRRLGVRASPGRETKFARLVRWLKPRARDPRRSS